MFVHVDDEDTLIKVLRKSVPEEKGPKPKRETLNGVWQGDVFSDQVAGARANTMPQDAAGISSPEAGPAQGNRQALERIPIFVERTFIHFPLPSDDRQSVSRSAPATFSK